MDDGMEELAEILRTLNDNVARLAAAQIAAADELHMIRRAMEGNPGDYDDPYANALNNAGISPGDGDPVMFG